MTSTGFSDFKIENEERSIEIKMGNICSSIQFEIMRLCMMAVHPEAHLQDAPEDQKEEEKKISPVISKQGYTEDQVREGYQTASILKEEPKPEPKPETFNQNTTNQDINNHSTYDLSRSIRTFHGVKHYQLFYICSDCGKKGKHYITPGTPSVICGNNECNHHMMVRQATLGGILEPDTFGNYYIAGEFKRSLKDKEEEDDFFSVEERAKI
ncbi:MAG: hypothetical protein ACI35R_11080, partial [Bacillus sp. (in: firmicutes)]